MERAGRFRLSLVDAASPTAFVAAAELGLDGTESPGELEARPEVIVLLDRLRRLAGVAMGLAPSPERSSWPTPRSPCSARPGPSARWTAGWWPPPTTTSGVRMLSMERARRAVPVTGALCLAVACRVAGSVAQAVATALAAPGDPVRVGNPSGIGQVAAEVAGAGGGWRAASASPGRLGR